MKSPVSAQKKVNRDATAERTTYHPTKVLFSHPKPSGVGLHTLYFDWMNL